MAELPTIRLALVKLSHTSDNEYFHYIYCRVLFLRAYRKITQPFPRSSKGPVTCPIRADELDCSRLVGLAEHPGTADQTLTSLHSSDSICLVLTDLLFFTHAAPLSFGRTGPSGTSSGLE